MIEWCISAGLAAILIGIGIIIGFMWAVGLYYNPDDDDKPKSDVGPPIPPKGGSATAGQTGDRVIIVRYIPEKRKHS